MVKGGQSQMKIEDISIDRKFADRLPQPSAGERAALVESIREHGVIVPIVVTNHGLLIDGHRRLDAAKEAGLDRVPVRIVECEAKTWGKAFAILVNLRRRHLNEACCADLASSLKRVEKVKARERQVEGQKKGREIRHGKKKLVPGNGAPEPKKKDDRANDRVAAAAGVSRKTLERVENVKKKDPELAARMLEGKISVAGAYKKVAVEELKAKSAEEARSAKPAPGLVRDLKTVAGTYRTIYADPPWSYGNSGTRGAAAQEYPTMSVEELKAFADIPNLAHPDGCHLWLWTTWPMIRDGAPHEVLKAWGFRWVGEIVWNKEAKGLGNWTRVNTEVLILAVRGDLKIASDTDGFLSAKRGRHSEKPDEARKLVEFASYEPRIELFSRSTIKGWDRWGNQA